MIPLIAENKDTIVRLCREYGIRKLDVFGSAVTGAFNADTSDIDFIVDLGGYERGVSRRYFGFADALEQALGREVDLVTEVQIRDPLLPSPRRGAANQCLCLWRQQSGCVMPYFL